mgnify:CR=1 FL=1
MERDILLGILLIVSGLSCMTYLILWSRKMIERIAERHLTSVRDIVKELHHGK